MVHLTETKSEPKKEGKETEAPPAREPEPEPEPEEEDEDDGGGFDLKGLLASPEAKAAMGTWNAQQAAIEAIEKKLVVIETWLVHVHAEIGTCPAAVKLRIDAMKAKAKGQGK